MAFRKQIQLAGQFVSQPDDLVSRQCDAKSISVMLLLLLLLLLMLLYVICSLERRRRAKGVVPPREVRSRRPQRCWSCRFSISICCCRKFLVPCRRSIVAPRSFCIPPRLVSHSTSFHIYIRSVAVVIFKLSSYSYRWWLDPCLKTNCFWAPNI